MLCLMLLCQVIFCINILEYLSQLEVTDIYYRGTYEHKRSLPNDALPKI